VPKKLSPEAAERERARLAARYSKLSPEDLQARKKRDARYYREATAQLIAADYQAFRDRNNTNRREHYRRTVLRPRELGKVDRTAERMQTLAQRRAAAIQMRAHLLIPDGDIDAFRERLLAAMPTRVG
jgi:hypothetical protein